MAAPETWGTADGFGTGIPGPDACMASTPDGSPCRNKAAKDQDYCSSHLGHGWPTRKEAWTYVENGVERVADMVADKKSKKSKSK